jgi:hypothetical protein
MLFKNVQCLSWGISLFIFLTMACAGYAYRVNARRPADDPQKRDFHLFAILLAPFTLPIFAVFFVSLCILRALLYGVFLILFTLALIFVRESFLFRWLHKMAVSIGNRLLTINTTLIKAFLRPWMEQPQIKRAPYSADLLFSSFV